MSLTSLIHFQISGRTEFRSWSSKSGPQSRHGYLGRMLLGILDSLATSQTPHSFSLQHLLCSCSIKHVFFSHFNFNQNNFPESDSKLLSQRICSCQTNPELQKSRARSLPLGTADHLSLYSAVPTPFPYNSYSSKFLLAHAS